MPAILAVFGLIGMAFMWLVWQAILIYIKMILLFLSIVGVAIALLHFQLVAATEGLMSE